MIETKIENPWDVQSLYEFLFFNCPSCTFKHNSKEDFLKHSFNNHTESVDFLRNISDGSTSDVAMSWLCNDFKSHEIINDEELKVEDDFHMETNHEISNLDIPEEIINDENIDNDKNTYQYNDNNHKTEMKTNINPSVVLKGIENLHCMECDKYFTSTEKLDIHITQLHEETNSFDLELDLTSDPLESDENQFDDDYDEDYETNNEKTKNLGMPEHKFEVKETRYESGKKKGQCRVQTTLLIAPNTFTRKSMKKEIITFQCNECNKEGYNTYAKAVIKKFDDDGLPVHELIQWPAHHECSPSPENHLVKEFSKNLYKAVEADPLKAISTIYEECLLKSTENLNADQKEGLLSNITTFEGMQSQLYKHRQKFIPKVPQEFADFDPAHDFVKKIDRNENFVKKDKTYFNKQTGKEGRVILMSSDKSLESFARAHTVSTNGTFKDHKCDSCDKSFKQSRDLKYHVQAVHEKSKDFECTYCGKFFTEIKNHIKNIHETNKQVKCEICSDIFPSKTEMFRHLREIHYSGQTELIDKSNFSSQSSIEVFDNIKVNLGEDLHKGPSLEDELEKNPEYLGQSLEEIDDDIKINSGQDLEDSELQFNSTDPKTNDMSYNEGSQTKVQVYKNQSSSTHIYHSHENQEENHSKEYSCDICGKKISHKWGLKKHVSIVHEKLRPHKCEICSKSFSKKDWLKNHIITVHERRRDYHCNECEKRYGTMPELRKHIKMKHTYNNDVIGKTKNKDFQCDRCPKSYSEARSLRNHIHQVHEGRKDHKCESCGESFYNKGYLKRHIQTVHEGLSFKCIHCSKSLSTETSMKNHILGVHEGRKDYTCDSCGMSYLLKSHLDRHFDRVHEGNKKEKNYKCDSCGKCFASPSDRDKHVRTVHEHKKDYSCEECGKLFSQSQSVAIHIRAVHEGRKEKCEYCGKVFSYVDKLKRHIRIVHQGQKYNKSNVVHV